MIGKTLDRYSFSTLICRGGMGIRHVYIEPRFPQLNAKLERAHRTDQEEFHQLLTYTDDVDLNKKFIAW